MTKRAKGFAKGFTNGFADGFATGLPTIHARRCRGRRESAQGGVEARQGAAGLFQVLLVIVEGAAVVTGEDEIPHLLRPVAVEDLADGEEVAQGLGHLLLVDAHEAVVHPDLDEGLAGRALGLGDLVLMVGKLEVRATAMDVEVIAQSAGGHGGAFDMPAGAAGAPGGSPGGLARLGGLPEGEVQGVTLGLPRLDATPGAQLRRVLAGEAAIAGETGHGIVDVPIVRGVGMALGDEGLDHGQDLVDVGGRPGFLRGGQDPQGGGVLVHGLNEPCRQVAEGLAALIGAVDDLVIDVGDVAHIGHGVTQVAQVAVNHVEHHHHPGVPQVTEVVNRHATDVHADLARFQGDEVGLAAGQAVVYLEHGRKGPE